MPTAYIVRPANEKRHFKKVTSKVKERFPNARWYVADSQYSSKELKRFIKEDLKGIPVIAKRCNEKIGEETSTLIRCSGATEAGRCASCTRGDQPARG